MCVCVYVPDPRDLKIYVCDIEAGWVCYACCQVQVPHRSTELLQYGHLFIDANDFLNISLSVSTPRKHMRNEHGNRETTGS